MTIVPVVNVLVVTSALLVNRAREKAPAPTLTIASARAETRSRGRSRPAGRAAGGVAWIGGCCIGVIPTFDRATGSGAGPQGGSRTWQPGWGLCRGSVVRI